MTQSDNPFLRGREIDPAGISGDLKVTELVESCFFAYNAGRLRDACALFTKKMLQDNVTIGLGVTGALTPAGLGRSCILPLIRAGFVDWIVSTGANLYHDAHRSLGLQMHRGQPHLNDIELREHEVVRIYDIVFDYDVLLSTDEFFRRIIDAEDFQREMSTATFHDLCGKYLLEREKALGLSEGTSLLSAAHLARVPIYTSSPGDSSIGMNVAARELQGSRLRLNPARDVNETAAIVREANRDGQTGILILGGGSPKNFLLQTQPQIQEVLGLDDVGQDYFLQFTDARPDTGGLSGATPSEAVSWGKVDPDHLPDAVVCYLDTSVALPILTSYALARREPRKLRRLLDRLDELHDTLKSEYLARQKG
ncbi:MAG: deoxyhypusine synthase [Planctomycetota bacterium]